MKNSTDVQRRSLEFGASEAARLYSKNPVSDTSTKSPEDANQQSSKATEISKPGDRINLSQEARTGSASNAVSRVNFESWGMSSGSQTESQSQKQVASVEKASSVKPLASPKEVKGSDLDRGLGALNGPSPGEMTISQSNDAQVVRKTDPSRKTTGFTVTPEQPVVSRN